jgi:hypothetical protein
MSPHDRNNLLVDVLRTLRNELRVGSSGYGQDELMTLNMIQIQVDELARDAVKNDTVSPELKHFIDTLKK